MEFYKNGYFYKVPETEEGYALYSHSCTTNKHYRFFYADGKLQQFYYSQEFRETFRNYKWTLKDKGKKLNINHNNGAGDIFEVIILNESTLKLKYLESYVSINRALIERAPSHVILKRVK